MTDELQWTPPERRSIRWRVEWRLKKKPDEWQPYAVNKRLPSQALHSYEAALAVPGCLEARVVQQETFTRESWSVIDPTELEGRI